MAVNSDHSCHGEGELFFFEMIKMESLNLITCLFAVLLLAHAKFGSQFLTMDAPMFDCAELSKEWDDSAGTRQRIRAGENLVQEVPGKGKSRDANIPQCVLNSEVLTPCVHRMFAAQQKLPDIGPLRDQVESFYLNNQRVVADNIVDDDSWELRKMLRLTKRKANRGDPSLATCFATTSLVYIWCFSQL